MTGGGDRQLQALGLSATAETVWQALLRWPDADRADLSSRAGADGDQVDAALQELQERGLVEPAPAPLGFAAADPRIAIEYAVAAEQRDLADRLTNLSALRAHLPALAQEYARGRQRIDAELPIEVVNGLEATRSRILMLEEAAHTEVLSVQEQLSPRPVVAALQQDLASLARGVAGRTLVQRDALADEEAFHYFGTVAAAGEQVRMVDQVPARLLVFDNEVAVVPLDASDRARGALFVRVRTIVDMCVFLFERMWADASPLFVVAANGAPSGRAARILELMAAGRKDETIARSLGVGVRTVRRDIAVLMADLGEHSRASTVAAAIRRGWLSP